MFPHLWEQFLDGLFQHDCVPVNNARFTEWMSDFGVEGLEQPAQSPELNTTEQHELEWRLQDSLSHPASMSDLTNALLE